MLRDFGQFEITQPEKLNIDDAIIQNIDCFGSANGSIQLLMSGGTTPYTFNWEKLLVAMLTHLFWKHCINSKPFTR